MAKFRKISENVIRKKILDDILDHPLRLTFHYKIINEMNYSYMFFHVKGVTKYLKTRDCFKLKIQAKNDEMSAKKCTRLFLDFSDSIYLSNLKYSDFLTTKKMWLNLSKENLLHSFLLLKGNAKKISY